MNGNIYVTKISVLDDLLKVIEKMSDSAEIALADKDNSINYILTQLNNRIEKINSRRRYWEYEYSNWLSKIHTTDKDGNKSINQHAQDMADKAKVNIEQCKELKNSATYHQQIMNVKAKKVIFVGYRDKCRQARYFIEQLRQHIKAYDSTEGFSAAQYQNYTKNSFENRNVMQREIDWNYVYEGKTNLERAIEGYSPYDKSGGKIHLHHVGMDYYGTLSEVPSRLHLSRYYNLHKLYPDHISFRRNSSLTYEFNQLRKNYWINRAYEYMDGGGR